MIPPARGERFPVLVSYAYLRGMGEPSLRALLDCPWADFMLDSGAFTVANSGGTVTLEEYCAFLSRWRDRFFQYVMLDVVGDPAATARNLDAMRRAGFDAMPVHVLGDGKDRMDELFDGSSRVCLGGLKRPGRGACPSSYVDAKMAWARGRPVHWLGYVKSEPVRKHRPYSCDSTAWSNGQMYGLMVFYLGGGRMAQFYNTDHHRASQNPALASHLGRLGFTLMDFRNPALWGGAGRAAVPPERRIARVVTTDSYVRYSIDMRRALGTRFFMATSLGTGAWPALLASIAANLGGILTAKEKADAALVK